MNSKRLLPLCGLICATAMLGACVGQGSSNAANESMYLEQRVQEHDTLLRSSRFNAWLSAGLGLVLGGALGNLVDRIRFRAVIDFVDVYVGQWHWPAFNVADMAICVGAFLACIVIWRTPEAPEKSKEKKS